MTSVIRIGQSKFVTIPIDEDSQERIMNCLQTLSALQLKQETEEIFLKDTKAAYSKMIHAQEVNFPLYVNYQRTTHVSSQKKAAEKKEKESKVTIVQVDDLLTFRQFSKKAADDAIDVGKSGKFVLYSAIDVSSV